MRASSTWRRSSCPVPPACRTGPGFWGRHRWAQRCRQLRVVSGPAWPRPLPTGPTGTAAPGPSSTSAAPSPPAVAALSLQTSSPPCSPTINTSPELGLVLGNYYNRSSNMVWLRLIVAKKRCVDTFALPRQIWPAVVALTSACAGYHQSS